MPGSAATGMLLNAAAAGASSSSSLSPSSSSWSGGISSSCDIFASWPSSPSPSSSSWSGGISSSSDIFASWSSSPPSSSWSGTVLNGQLAGNAASISWANNKDSNDRKRLSSENPALEPSSSYSSSASVSASSSSGLSSTMSSRSSSSSSSRSCCCSAAARFGSRVQESKSRGGRTSSNLASCSQQLGFASSSQAMAAWKGSSLLSLPSLCLKRAMRNNNNNAANPNRSHIDPIRALGRSGQDCGDKLKEMGDAAGDMQEALEGNWHTELSHATNTAGDQSEASWEQMGMVFRVVYAVAMYGGLAFAGSVICNFTGVDLWGGFDLSPQVITTGFGYAVPPMTVLLFILEDEIVKNCGAARAIRDVEDEELMDFFVGMSLWQFPFVVAAGAVAEELFFRVSIQGGLAHAFQVSDKGMSETTIGLASLTGVIPMFVPFAHLFAAVLTAALTGSMYYVISSPNDPKYVVAPAIRGRNNRRDIKARVEAWYARRQQKKIYSPLVESLLALYLGFEWMHTGNILAPIITHTLYSLVIVGNGLRRIHDNREKLRQRVNKITGQQRLASLEGREFGPEKIN